MSETSVDVRTDVDGTMVIQPRGAVAVAVPIATTSATRANGRANGTPPTMQRT